MRYAITGGAGFIGSHLARLLLRHGHEVEIVDNFSTGTMANLAEIKFMIKFHDIDIREAQELGQALAGKDGIFHLAALTSVANSYDCRQEYEEVNVRGTQNVLEVAAEHQTKVVLASSSAVYGNPSAIPTPESADLRPENPYGITKLEDEILAKRYADRTDIVALRYYNMYGGDPGSSQAGVVSRFYRNVMSGSPPVIEGDGRQQRDFVHVEDAVQATMHAMEKKTGSLAINIGSGKSVSILELAALFIRCSGRGLVSSFGREPQGNVRESRADITLARELLGWEPQTKLEEWVESLFRR
ncbi:MAG: GDP-mannose 4,6-dehydratase [Thaumarchaeota archaeon]|nr:GDP-mannose 4,6-dehydratase [Nitrososphaerota archaeon]